MLVHGFSIDFMLELVRTGLASATTERVAMGPRTIEVARVRRRGGGQRSERHRPRWPFRAERGGGSEPRRRQGLAIALFT